MWPIIVILLLSPVGCVFGKKESWHAANVTKMVETFSCFNVWFQKVYSTKAIISFLYLSP